MNNKMVFLYCIFLCKFVFKIKWKPINWNLTLSLQIALEISHIKMASLLTKYKSLLIGWNLLSTKYLTIQLLVFLLHIVNVIKVYFVLPIWFITDLYDIENKDRTCENS